MALGGSAQPGPHRPGPRDPEGDKEEASAGDPKGSDAYPRGFSASTLAGCSTNGTGVVLGTPGGGRAGVACAWQAAGRASRPPLPRGWRPGATWAAVGGAGARATRERRTPGPRWAGRLCGARAPPRGHARGRHVRQGRPVPIPPRLYLPHWGTCLALYLVILLGRRHGPISIEGIGPTQRLPPFKDEGRRRPEAQSSPASKPCLLSCTFGGLSSRIG